MATETSERTQAMLEQLTNAQSQIVNYIAVGFVLGFLLGLLAAWMMVR